MASFSCRISPRTSTVILRERSPFATAIVTSAMLRICAVRFDAIWFTESVSSFQTPDTPFTFAWPPSLPSVPTSRATRVTSDENSVICSSMRLTSVAERRNSPCSGRPSASSGTERVRSPFATPAIASVIVSTGRIRSSMRLLTDRSISAHVPRRSAGGRRWRVRPLRPTCSPARLRPSASRRLWSTISLKLSASLPAMPSQCPGNATEKSPAPTARIARSSAFKGSISELDFAAVSARSDFVDTATGKTSLVLRFHLLMEKATTRPRRRASRSRAHAERYS